MNDVFSAQETAETQYVLGSSFDRSNWLALFSFTNRKSHAFNIRQPLGTITQKQVDVDYLLWIGSAIILVLSCKEAGRLFIPFCRDQHVLQ